LQCFHKFETSIISASVTDVPECQTTLCRLLFMQYKITWLARMHLCRLVGVRLYR